ncbi:MAG: hypothetical protein MI867_10110 [Pseudomonadales bacterium]|nr:hypothetical protein [Pseudomonadales bacterium]
MPPSATSDTDAATARSVEALVQRHLRTGWLALVVFVALGITLETLHGFKIGWYLDVANTVRRHMFTLAHAHGTLLGLLHLVFAATAPRLADGGPRALGVISACLTAATILLPGGFFAGGLVIYDGDPGLGILLVPPGGLLLLVAVATGAYCALKKSA